MLVEAHPEYAAAFAVALLERNAADLTAQLMYDGLTGVVYRRVVG